MACRFLSNRHQFGRGGLIARHACSRSFPFRTAPPSPPDGDQNGPILGNFALATCLELRGFVGLVRNFNGPDQTTNLRVVWRLRLVGPNEKRAGPDDHLGDPVRGHVEPRARAAVIWSSALAKCFQSSRSVAPCGYSGGRFAKGGAQGLATVARAFQRIELSAEMLRHCLLDHRGKASFLSEKHRICAAYGDADRAAADYGWKFH
jgi:hypothetical protein